MFTADQAARAIFIKDRIKLIETQLKAEPGRSIRLFYSGSGHGFEYLLGDTTRRIVGTLIYADMMAERDALLAEAETIGFEIDGPDSENPAPIL